MPVQVTIQWCGSWGYEATYQKAEKTLRSKFGDGVSLESIKDEETTGNFEIIVAGKLIHSKHTDGEWRTHNQKQRVYVAILEELKKDEINAPLIATIQVEDEAEGEEKADNRSVLVSMCTLLISIPALIGAWCWPALVIAALSGSVSAAARSLGHVISLAVTGFMMIVVNGFMLYTIKKRDRSRGFLFYYGPLILTLIATPLILADIVRHVLQDNGVWKECDRADNVMWSDDCTWSSSQYKCNLTPPSCVPDSQETMAHLAPMGVLFTIVFTYLGFFCLMIGTLWNANICQKLQEIRAQWNELRGNVQ